MGLTINLIWDPSVSSAPAGFTGAVEAAAQFLDQLISTPITANIMVGWGEDDNNAFTIGSGDAAIGGPLSGIELTYAQLKAALLAHVTSSADAVALANLPAADPSNGGEFFISTAQEKAWGLLPATDSAVDGAVGFSSAYTYTFDPNNRAVTGELDLIGVAEHELTHALGRIVSLPPNIFTSLDLFRYSAPGTLQLVAGQPAYFSIDGGKTVINNYDTVADFADWNSSVIGDSFGYGYSGVTLAVTTGDITEVNLLGYTIAVPIVTAVAFTGPQLTNGAGLLAAGQTVTIDVDFSHPIAVSGVPSLSLNDGGTATFGGGSGTSVLSFAYTVGAKDTSVSSLEISSVNLNGGAIVDGAANNANLSLNGLAQAGPQIEGKSSAVTVNVQNVSVGENAAVPASMLITGITNPNGDTLSQYAFWDGGSGNGHFAVNGTAQPDGQWFMVPFASLGTVQYVGGAVPGTETLFAQVFDATTGTWSASSSLTATTMATHVPATVDVQNVSVAENASIAASSLIASVVNPSGDTISQYGFFDGGTGNGHFVINGTAEPDGQWIDVSAANLGTAQYVGGAAPGSETLSVEVYDATTSTWSPPSSLTATTTSAHVAPTVSVQNVTVAENAAAAASSFVTGITNPSGDSITQYGFWDGGTGNGHLAVSGVAQPDGQWITVSTANLASVQYFGGAQPGSETLYAEVFDATTDAWSAASSLTATTVMPSGSKTTVFAAGPDGVDMETLTAFAPVVSYTLSPTTLTTVLATGNTELYTGNFVIQNGALVGGTANDYEQFDNGTPVFSITNGDLPYNVWTSQSGSDFGMALEQFMLVPGTTYVGSSGTDVLVGAAGNDVFIGGSGTETFVPAGGVNTITGGTGIDTVDLSSPFASYTISANGSGVLTVASAASTENITFASVGYLQFSDQTRDAAPNAGEADVALLYPAALGRLPDAQGLSGWLAIYNNLPASAQGLGPYALSDVPGGYSGNLSIAAGFTDSAEFTAKYGSLTNQQFVTQLYANVLDRAPDPAGLAGWLAQLSQGVSREHVLIGFADSAEAISNATMGFTGQSGYHAPWLIIA